jgi:hypothetical protein
MCGIKAHPAPFPPHPRRPGICPRLAPIRPGHQRPGIGNTPLLRIIWATAGSSYPPGHASQRMVVVSAIYRSLMPRAGNGRSATVACDPSVAHHIQNTLVRLRQCAVSDISVLVIQRGLQIATIARARSASAPRACRDWITRRGAGHMWRRVVTRSNRESERARCVEARNSVGGILLGSDAADDTGVDVSVVERRMR